MLHHNRRHLQPANNSNTAEDKINGVVEDEAGSSDQEEGEELGNKYEEEEEEEEEETQTETPIKVTPSGRVV